MKRQNILFLAFFIISMPFTIHAEWKDWFVQGAQWSGNIIKNQWLGCSVAIGGCWYIHQLHKQNHQQLAKENDTLKKELVDLKESGNFNKIVASNIDNCLKKQESLQMQCNENKSNISMLNNQVNFLNKQMPLLQEQTAKLNQQTINLKLEMRFLEWKLQKDMNLELKRLNKKLSATNVDDLRKKLDELM